MVEPQYRHVLVPLDGSDLADAAMGTAWALADHFAADLMTISVARSPGDVGKLRSHATNMVGVLDSDRRASVVVDDDVAGAVVKRAAELAPSLLCLSSHGHGRFAGAVIGSVARSLLQSIDEPIIVVGPYADRPSEMVPKPPPPLSIRQLVACIDGGPASEQVVPVAVAWASALAMSLTILTVADPSTPPVRPGATWRRTHGPNEDADAYVERVAERYRDAAVAVDTQVVYDPISPAHGLQTYLAEHPAGLIALTTHARTGLRRALLGASAAAMVRWSTAPALVVPLTAQ
jgi:nucleotide-binding universal stress UspA family protein